MNSIEILEVLKKIRFLKFLSNSKDRLGGCRITADVRSSVDWMNSNSLLDLRLNGASFRWSNNQHRPSMARLDRFPISGDWAEVYPHVCQIKQHGFLV